MGRAGTASPGRRGKTRRPQVVRTDLGETARVRKQYQFRPGEHGLDAWDVDNPIRADAHLPLTEVALDTIKEAGTDYWFNVGPVPTVRRMVDQVRLIQGWIAPG